MGMEAYTCSPNTQEAEDLKSETSLGHMQGPISKTKKYVFLLRVKLKRSRACFLLVQSSSAIKPAAPPRFLKVKVVFT